jgi:microcystin-dependent protein
VYPVGSVYINATSSTNPSSLLGFGTWVEFGAGKVLVGLDSADTLFDTLEETGGSKDAITVSHTHTATTTATDSGHTHGYTAPSLSPNNAAGSIPDYITTTSGTTATGTANITATTTVASAGSSGTNANIQPYITVRMWKRTA